MTDTKYLSTKAAIRYLKETLGVHCSLATINRLRKDRKIEFARIGNSCYYRPESLERFVNSKFVKAAK